jgi:hypothetical protein
MTTQEEMSYLLKCMDETKDFDTYLELKWQFDFLEQSLATELQNFDLNEA